MATKTFLFKEVFTKMNLKNCPEKSRKNVNLITKVCEINANFLYVNCFVATGAKFCTSGGLECAQFSFNNC
jgi:hypothetical protein